LVQQFAIFFPTVQGRQGVELAFDGPVGANHYVGAAEQPNAHYALQHIGPFQPVGQIQTLFNELLAQSFFVHR
jgi:hypothetical protein